MPTPPGLPDGRPRLRVLDALPPTDVARVLALGQAVAVADGAHPLSEHVVLHLRHGSDDSLHLLAEDPVTGELLGYAHLDTGDAEGPAAELAVSPSARRRGVGTRLLTELMERAGTSGGLRLWAHGSETAAAQLAAVHGFTRIRRLWQMRRSLFAPLDPVELPADVRLRPFDPTHDVEAWLDLNRRSFADLPDQAAWTGADLARRMAEPWFDPTGFLLATDGHDQLMGFHWTKVHDHAVPVDGLHTPHDPIGEVYVVGVDPAHRGLGLGRALTLAGLHHLRARGLPAALLYVDASNEAAVALYRSLGFSAWDSDTLFRR